MISIMRTIIDIPEKVIQSLDELGVRENRSRASLIREAVDGFLQAKFKPSLEAAFGIWKKSPKDGVQYQQAIRDEWDHS